MENLSFEWDENKNVANKAKHGIDFETAALVFSDRRRVEFIDTIHSTDEERYITIGMAYKVLFVVYTERQDVIRMISARLATAKERRLYYGDDKKDY